MDHALPFVPATAYIAAFYDGSEASHVLRGFRFCEESALGLCEHVIYPDPDPDPDHNLDHDHDHDHDHDPDLDPDHDHDHNLDPDHDHDHDPDPDHNLDPDRSALTLSIAAFISDSSAMNP